MSTRPQVAPDAPTPLLKGWQQLVQRAPEATALIEAAPEKIYTRAGLEALADAFAARVSSFPRLNGARIAFALPNGAGWFATFLGILKSGATPIPLDASEPLSHRRTLAEAGGARFLWTGETLEPIASVTRDLPGLCVIKLTSGSTGTPRALPFTDAEMLADGRQICATMGIAPEDVNLAIVPFGHSYGLGNLVFPLLDQGTAALCVSAPLPHAIAADVARWKPTVFPAVPALLRVLNLSDLPRDAFAPLRTVISAGSMLAPEIAQGFYEKYQRLVHGFYGSSETGGICYDGSGEASLAGRSVGTPLEGVRLRFAVGQRFWVESAAVYTRGNRNRSAEGLGAYRPADRAQLNLEGELQLLGRAGRMMKIAGRRIDLSELERALRRLPRIHDAFVAPHPRHPEELAAALATDLPPDEARALLRREFAAWKIPRRLLVLKQFPLTGRGKTDTRALRETLAAE